MSFLFQILHFRESFKPKGFRRKKTKSFLFIFLHSGFLKMLESNKIYSAKNPLEIFMSIPRKLNFLFNKTIKTNRNIYFFFELLWHFNPAERNWNKTLRKELSIKRSKKSNFRIIKTFDKITKMIIFHFSCWEIENLFLIKEFIRFQLKYD
jgi:archaellum biogenesis ATPase FlaH